LPGRVKARLLASRERPQAEARLATCPRRNLFLLDLVGRVGHPGGADGIPPQVLGAWRTAGLRGETELLGLAALRPSLVLDASMDPCVLEAFLPHLDGLESGLVKSTEALVAPLWERLRRRGRRAVIDRREMACAVEPGELRAVPPPAGARIRRARPEDLEALVAAARASLREEQRPDPFLGDPSGFRRWVRGRVPRARVIEWEGRVVFVGYADVRRPEGWLVQGVYTWPDERRRGLAAAGMTALVHEAFDAGADHVQLAVVEGNRAAMELYRSLGFREFDWLRTILFA